MSPLILTIMTMFAFAANSILCRLALQSGAIDATSFTYLRLISGAITLVVLHSLFVKKSQRKYQLEFSIKAGISLFIYALCFSIAYLELSAGTGALLLFGTVQITLITVHITQGNTIQKREWLGLIISIVGFIYLMLPNIEKPDTLSAILMIISGLAWAIFTLLGRNSGNPVTAISQGFWLAGIICLLLSPWLITLSSSSVYGIILALISGSIASAAGYILWYKVITHITMLQASIAQLSVPVIALIAGVIVLGETLTLRTVIISGLILGGIGLTNLGKK